jgi:MFS transporter, DHA1 family, multidrug resistance protein
MTNSLLRKRSVKERGKTPISVGRVLWAVGLGTGLSLLGDSAMYTVLPTHTAEAGILLVSVGIMLSANRFIRLLLNGPVGWLCDRWPRRRVFLPALFLGVLSTGLYAATSGYWPLLLARLLWGASWSGIWVAGNAIILDITRASNRGHLVGLYNISFFAGAAAGAVMGGWLTDLIGYRGAFTMATLLSLLGAIVAWWLLPETFRGRREPAGTEPVEMAVSPAPRSPLPTPRRPWGQIFSAMTLMAANRLAIPGILLATFGRYLLETFGETLLLAGRSLGVATMTGLGLGSMTILSMVSVWVTGRLSDGHANRWWMVTFGLLPGVAGFGLLLWAAPWAVMVGLLLTAVTSGSNQGLATALIGDLVGPAEHGRFLGILFTIGDLGSAIGPLLGFWLLTWVSVGWLYGGTGLLFAAMLLLAAGWALR